MAGDVPQWAKERAIALLNESYPARNGRASWRPSTDGGHPTVLAFARYIAEHEEPPVDPLLIEARNLWSLMFEGSQQAAILRGEHDDAPTLQALLAALEGGIELAKAGGS